MGIPKQITCIVCNHTGPFPSFKNDQDESSFETYGKYGVHPMVRCKKCNSFNLLDARIVGKTKVVDSIKPDNPEHSNIVQKHDELFKQFDKDSELEQDL